MDRINIPQLALGASSVAFLIAFFMGGKDLVFATEVLLIATLFAGALCACFWRKTNLKTWAMLVSILIFSGLTVYFDNDLFIKWRPTVINAVLCLALLGMYFLKIMPFKMVFSKNLELDLPDSIWLKQNLIWTVYFFISGLINTVLILWGISNEGWILYKTIVGPILATLFMIAMFIYLFRENKRRKNLLKNDE